MLGAKYICKLWQVGDFAQNFIYSSLCYFSFHKQHPSSKVSRHVCLPKAKYSSAVTTGSKDYLPNSYPLYIHKTTEVSGALSPVNAPVDSAQEIKIQHCTQTSCAFCCCSANQIRFPCYLIHFALIKAKFRTEGNSSPLWER